MQQLSSNTKFWTITILSVLAYSGLYIITNSINNLDELHYLSLAWEMHKQHYYLLPIALGHPDIQKPPLLYWLINLGWSLFGYSTTWPLMLITLINLGCLYTTFCIARKLFPDTPLIAQLAVVVLATGVFWFHFFNRIRFDGLLALFTVMTINFSINTYRTHQLKWSLLTGVCLGLGFLAKGAAILVFALPFYLLLPRYETTHYHYSKWLGHLLLSILVSLLVVACWAIPLYISLGHKLIDVMFIKQQHSRLTLSHHLGELPTLLLTLLPWTVLPLVLGNLKSLFNKPIQKPVWLLLWTALLSGLFFTFMVLMHVKRYLLPLYPLLAIVLAYIICLDVNEKMLTLQNRLLSLICTVGGAVLIAMGFVHSKKLIHLFPETHTYVIWGVVLLLAAWSAIRLDRHVSVTNKLMISIGLILVGLVTSVAGINGIFTHANNQFLEKLALQMKTNQERHIPQANLISGGYQAFDFKGHLQQPLPLFTENSPQFHNWLNAHPNGILYFSSRKSVRACMAAQAFALKGSDRIISIVSVQQYLAACRIER